MDRRPECGMHRPGAASGRGRALGFFSLQVVTMQCGNNVFESHTESVRRPVAKLEK